MIGSAKQCMMDLYFTVWPSSSTGMLCVKIHRLLSETVSNNKTTINTEVVHAGMASNNPHECGESKDRDKSLFYNCQPRDSECFDREKP